MDLTFLRNKNILILGAGLTGMSCARFLRSHDLNFSLNDSRPDIIDTEHFAKDFPDTQISLGAWDKALIADAEAIIASPGVDLNQPDIQEAISENCDLLGDIELYCRLKDTSILAVTGSNGKSTLVSLLAFLGQALGIDAQLGGNIGAPVLDSIEQEPEVLVLELSSFQLETLSSMKAVAASILNISDDHLDRHRTMANYQAIKQNIYQDCRLAVVNRDDALTLVDEKYAPESVVSIGTDKPEQGHFGIAQFEGEQCLMFGEQALIKLIELPLSGLHNALNCMAALAMGQSAGWPLLAMVEKLKGFTGLPHRCQAIETRDGVRWINDSKATNVGATLAAIEGLANTLSSSNKLILIAGGDGKGADFSPLSAAINEHVDWLITLGKDGREIAKLKADSIFTRTMDEAVACARTKAEKGDLVLLSPACASLDMFKNFAARGEAFVNAVQAGQEAYI